MSLNADFKSAFGSAKYLKRMTILNVLLLLNSFKADINSLRYLVNIFIGSFLNHYWGAYTGQKCYARLIFDEGQAPGLHGLLNITTQYVNDINEFKIINQTNYTQSESKTGCFAKIAKISERNTLHRKVALLRIEIGTRAQFLQSLRLHQIVVPHLAFYPKKREKQVVIINFFF